MGEHRRHCQFKKKMDDGFIKHRLEFHNNAQIGQIFFPINTANKNVINKIFDKLHQNGKMDWTKTPTFFVFPVFVVWKTANNGKRKFKIIIDIRNFNKLTITDFYQLQFQPNIINVLHGMRNINGMDKFAFFFQLPIIKNRLA